MNRVHRSTVLSRIFLNRLHDCDAYDVGAISRSHMLELARSQPR